MGFPVNIAAGALLTILGGMILRHFDVQNYMGWWMVAFFILGSGLAFAIRNQSWVESKWNNFMCWLGQ